MKLILDQHKLTEYASDKRYWQGIPAVEVTAKGRIFAASSNPPLGAYAGG